MTLVGVVEGDGRLYKPHFEIYTHCLDTDSDASDQMKLAWKLGSALSLGESNSENDDKHCDYRSSTRTDNDPLKSEATEKSWARHHWLQRGGTRTQHTYTTLEGYTTNNALTGEHKDYCNYVDNLTLPEVDLTAPSKDASKENSILANHYRDYLKPLQQGSPAMERLSSYMTNNPNMFSNVNVVVEDSRVLVIKEGDQDQNPGLGRAMWLKWKAEIDSQPLEGADV